MIIKILSHYKIAENLDKATLNKIYEEKGWKGKAIENYEKFLNLWKNADPNIHEIIDAKKQLAALHSK